MKILIATGIFPPDIGGPALYSQKLAEEFSSRGLVVSVITYGKNFFKNNAYLISGVSRKWPFGLRQAIYFLKLLNQARKSDVILTFDSLGAGLPAVIAGKLFNKKVVIRLGGDFLWEKFVESGRGKVTMAEFYQKKLHQRFIILFRLMIFALQNTDKIVFTTEFQKGLFVSYYGLRPNKVFMIRNVFEKKNGQLLIYDNNLKTILWAGRFLKLKNLDLLLRVFKRLLVYDKNLVLELAGEGPERRTLQLTADNLQVTNNIKFLGKLSEFELKKKIINSYFCILPSLSEVSPNFALQCLALEKPIILTEETGLKEQFPGLMYADPQKEDSFFQSALRLLDANSYDNYQKFISDIHYQKTWRDLADEYLKILDPH